VSFKDIDLYRYHHHLLLFLLWHMRALHCGVDYISPLWCVICRSQQVHRVGEVLPAAGQVLPDHHRVRQHDPRLQRAC
jgi:hypothetical protein